MSTLSLHDALPITIVVYGLAVAALVMTGATLGERIGWALIFRCVLGVFAASSLAMILSRTVTWAIIGQLLAGAAAAIIVPALVALIAENYRGPQQATAVGSLGSARILGGQRVPDRRHAGHLRGLEADLRHHPGAGDRRLRPELLAALGSRGSLDPHRPGRLRPEDRKSVV